MATIPGTYVQTGLSSNIRTNAIVDVLLAPQMAEFRQLSIYHERGTKIGDKTFRFSYQNWNPDYPVQIFLNNNPNQMASGYSVTHLMGTVYLATVNAGDYILATYNFDYFPIYVLEGFIMRSIDIINSAAVGASTFYTLATAPTNWDGVIADLTIAMCMEKLILDYDLWKGRLIFAISPQGLSDGSSDVVAQLEAIKRNVEERAYKSIDNVKFKVGDHLAEPTQSYYDSLLVGSSSRRGQHGGQMGKLRGWKINKYLGRVMS